MSKKHIQFPDKQIVLELVGAMLGWRAKLKREREDIDDEIIELEGFLERLPPGILRSGDTNAYLKKMTAHRNF